MNSSHCSPTRMWHTYAHIHTEVQIRVKVLQRHLSATVDTQDTCGTRVTGWETWCQCDTLPHSMHTAQPWSSAGTHHKQRLQRGHSKTQRHKSFLWGPGHNQRTADREEEQCHAHTPRSIRAAQEMKQRLRLRPTSSYTNILQGVTVTHRHSVHAHGLTRHGPTQARPTHGGLTRQGRAVVPTRPDSCRSTRSARGVPPRPSGRRPPRHTQTHCHTSGPRRRGPHTRTHPRGRGPHTPSSRPGLGQVPAAHRAARSRGRRAPAPPSGHTPPTCPCAGGRESRGLSTFRAAPAPGPRGEAGPRRTGPQPAAGANPGVRGASPPLPSPASAGSPGGEGSRGGSLGSGWSPSFPSGPHWAGSRAEGGQPRPSCPLPLTCLGPGTGSAREGEREGRGEREDRKSPSASISGHQCAVSFVSTVNVCV